MMYKGSDVPVAKPYPQSEVIDDSAFSAFTMPLPQLRQRLLLAALRAALDPDGEPARIVAHATQMGGVVRIAGGPEKRQAWRLLLDRYMVTSSVGAGDHARALFGLQMRWPKEVTSASWQGFYSEVVDKAERAGYFPQDDGAESVRLRSSWWHVLTEPMGSSPHWADLIKLALVSLAYTTGTRRCCRWRPTSTRW